MSPPNTSPPTHSIAFVILVLAICVAFVPNILSTIDEVATIERCTSPLFPDVISISTLGWIRVGFAGFIGIVSTYRMTEIDVLQINYMKGSKLKSLPDGIVVSGLRTQAAFTSWCWNLLGISFAVTGLLTLFVEDRRTRFGLSNDEMNELPHMEWVLRASVLLFEIAAPLSSLVSFVVTYVLWPKALKGNGSDGCKRIPILIQHNANVIMSLVEVGLLGHLPMRMSDLPLAPLFGIAYVFFSWSVRFHWVPSGDPQFLYFFFDTTLGKTSTIALVILVAILVVFYAIFVLIDDIIAYFGGGFSVHVCVVTTISMLVCRFRD